MSTNPPKNRPAASRWPLIGQAVLGARLIQALQDHAVPQVVLFSGVSGLGKRTGARWLAQLDLCQGPGQRPCNQCSSCQQIKHRSHPRLTVLDRHDGATITVEQVREILNQLHLRLGPNERHWVILDSVERLTENAANALLKFLEEPGSGVQMFLTTSQVDRLPLTVRSRAAIYMWHPVPRKELLAAQSGIQNRSRLNQLVDRAAGRPGVFIRLSQTSERTDQETASVEQMLEALQPGNATAWQARLSELPEEQVAEHFHIWELVLREMLLAKLEVASRRLWPNASKKFENAVTTVSLDTLNRRLERWQQRTQLLQQHVSPRFILADLLVS